MNGDVKRSYQLSLCMSESEICNVTDGLSSLLWQHDQVDGTIRLSQVEYDDLQALLSLLRETRP